MTSGLISAILLGAAALITATYNSYSSWRERTARIAQQAGTIRLTKQQENQVAEQAAAIQSQDRIATERWWKEQFDAVKDELADEQEWRRQVTRNFREHAKWDREARRQLEQRGLSLDPPPPLDPNEPTT